MIYCIALLVALLSGCASDPVIYSPKGWPRPVVLQSSLITEEEIRQVEIARIAIDEINRRVGAAVFQLAITSDIEAAGCGTIRLSFVDRVTCGTDKQHLGCFWATGECFGRAELRVDADETAAVHELLHSILGIEHDEDRNSVFYPATWRCFYRPDLPEEEQVSQCEEEDRQSITQDIVDRIRAKMKLPQVEPA